MFKNIIDWLKNIFAQPIVEQAILNFIRVEIQKLVSTNGMAYTKQQIITKVLQAIQNKLGNVKGDLVKVVTQEVNSVLK